MGVACQGQTTDCVEPKIACCQHRQTSDLVKAADMQPDNVISLWQHFSCVPQDVVKKRVLL